MKLALFYSRQPYNQYAGGPTGVKDSENFWMYTFTLQLAALLALRPGVEVVVEPRNIDYNRDGTLTYKDNVAWGNAQPGVAFFVSHHSNAEGDSCVLTGRTAASHALKDAFIKELNANNFMPFGDVWTFNSRLVSEMTQTYSPSVLLEFGRHDREDYAKWLRDHINDGSMAAWIDGIYARVFRLAAASSDLIISQPSETPNAPAPEFPLREPRKLDGTVEHGTQIAIVQQIVNAKIDGTYGPITKRKTQELQARLGQTQDGRFGADTAEAYLLSQPNLYAGRPGMVEGAVKLLQHLIWETPDGVFGPKTTNALKSAQVWADLKPDGNAGVETKRAVVR